MILKFKVYEQTISLQATKSGTVTDDATVML